MKRKTKKKAKARKAGRCLVCGTAINWTGNRPRKTCSDYHRLKLHLILKAGGRPPFA